MQQTVFVVLLFQSTMGWTTRRHKTLVTLFLTKLRKLNNKNIIEDLPAINDYAVYVCSVWIFVKAYVCVIYFVLLLLCN